eukprot:Phypoly_transcript_03757.p1 GENE.Phypoly_transcript_03757~~Phypoly_transcript_03757.p1  ORF type:complete len:597 (+),score=67.79 Phypoly_transcript_03757:134-1924(+)
MFSICAVRKDHGTLLCGRNYTHGQDIIVDISDLYYYVLRKEHIAKGYFTTSKSHRETIEHQILVYSQCYVSDEGFWAFITNSGRKAFLPLHRRIEEFVKLGIPPQYRSRIWRAMIGCQAKPVHYMAYADLLEVPYPGESISATCHAMAHPFPALKERYYSDRILRVMTAYAVRNPNIGYCQVMTSLASTLLIFLEEEMALWLLVHITEEWLPEYYVLTMPGFHTDTLLLGWLISTNLPLLHKHLEKINFSLGTLTSSWFMRLFVHDFPPETAFLIWDNIFMEGVSVIFEVALAILNMVHDEILQLTDESDVVTCIHRSTKNLYDPTLLLKNWQVLDKESVNSARKKIREKMDDEPRRTAISAQIVDLEIRTHFSAQEIKNLWHQFDSLLPFGSQGFNFSRFSHFVKSTFSEWAVDHDLLEKLFSITDLTGDGFVNFFELTTLLSVMCRGTFKEIVAFNFKLFDTESKGWIDKADLYRMLRMIYGMFDKDAHFHKMICFFADSICNFDYPGKEEGVISLEAFENVVAVQPQIMARFMAKDPRTKFNIKHTYYYWMFAPEKERPNRSSENIQIQLYHGSDRKTPKARTTPSRVYVCGS